MNFYSVERIASLQDVQYRLLMGGRNIGKSYSAKKYILQKAIDNNSEFIYLRRWKDYVTPVDVKKYFGDLNIEEMTNGDYNDVYCWQGAIYLAKMEEGKRTGKKLVGYYHALSQHERYKSQMYPNVTDIIFEEFITEDKPYLPNEPNLLQEYVSTIFRTITANVWLIGNLLTKLSPYMSEWGLDRVPRQKRGTIDIYNMITPTLNEDGEIEEVIVKIAVEYCTAQGVLSRMSFGSSANMIVRNEWRVKRQAQLSKDMKKYSETLHTIFFIVDNLTFKMELRQYKACVFWFVTPFTSTLKHPEDTRLVSTEPSPWPLHTNTFYPLSPREQTAINLLKHGKVFFDSDGTGTDFNQGLKKVGF